MGTLRRRTPTLLLLVAAGFAGSAVTRAQTVYLAFGDSITEGVGDDEERELLGYPPRLEGLLRQSGLDALVENHGLGGEKTPEGLTRIDDVLALGGDVLLVMEGSNDISVSISLETTAFNLEEMARKATEAGLQTVHATLIPRVPWARRDAGNVLNRILCEEIRHLAGSEDRLLVDNFEILGSIPDVFETHYSQAADDFVGHPNAEGYDLVAQSFFDVLTGVDAVPPVTGRLSPPNGAVDVAPEAELFVELWDFGEGMDLAQTELFVGTQAAPVTPSGDGRRAEFRFVPLGGFSDVVRVRVRSVDRASPPNTLDREILRFTVAGTELLASDFNLDGRVDGADLVRLAVAFGARVGDSRFDAATDLVADRLIDGSDLAVLASEFGRSTF